jgi:YidC/Oxa1 family membrane protein insertase
MSVLFGVPVGAAYHLVFALTQLLVPVAGGLAAVAAIVLFTAAVRLLLSPLSLRALRGQAAMSRVAPQVKELRTRYGGQPERFQRELAALYKREGASPFASLVPLLVQWPFLSVMYLLFRSVSVDGGQNQLLSRGLFGVPLGAHWLSGASVLSVHDGLFLAVFAVLAALCWLSARLARRPVPASTVPASTVPASTVPDGPEPAAAGVLARVLPYVTVVIAAFAPLAAVVYLVTTVAWSLAERRLFANRSNRTV